MRTDVRTRCTVTGPADEIARFRARMIRPMYMHTPQPNDTHCKFDFRLLIPTPQAILDRDDNMERFAWQRANWGSCKGAFFYEEVSADPFTFSFSTVDTFPTRIFERLAIDFPLLVFECVSFDEGLEYAASGFFNGPPGARPFTVFSPQVILQARAF